MVVQWVFTSMARAQSAGSGTSGSQLAETGASTSIVGVAAVLLGAGLAVAVISLVHVLRRQLHMANTLRLSQARLRQALDSAGYAPWDWHIASKQLTISDTWERMLGYEPGELKPTPQSWAQMIHPEDLDRVIDGLHLHLDGTSEHYEDDYRLRRKDGTYIWVHISGEVVERRASGQPVRISGVQEDITWRKEAEEELRQRTVELERARAAAEELAVKAEAASRAKTEFLANVSHEIRTPMSAILGFTDLLQDGQASREERAGYVQTIRRNADQLLAIIDDILDYSALESSTLQLKPERMDVIEQVEQVTAAMAVRAAEKSIEFAVEWQGAVPRYVQADAHRFKQILQNLLTNAVKFTKQGSVRVVIDYTKQQGLRLRVIDTGIGIASMDLLKLFRPFAQVDTSSTRKFGGTGLGLAICKRLSQMMGGELTVLSKPGKGSTFTFSLPASACDEASLAAVAAIGSNSEQISGLRVLLVDDGVDNRRLLGLHLKKMGVVATFAEDGRQAIELVRLQAADGHPFHIVLMDMQMPEIDGYSASAELRAAGVRTTIIAVTAHAGAEDRNRCLAAGCDDYLTKPVDVGLLRQRLAAHAARARAIAAAACEADGRDDPEIPDGLKLLAATGDAEGKQVNRETNMVIRSEYADDPDMAEILTPFVQSLAERVNDIRAAVASGNVEDLARLAHQIKGAAGGYGFPSLTKLAADVEAPLKSGGDINSVRLLVDCLIGEIGRVEGIGQWMKAA